MVEPITPAATIPASGHLQRGLGSRPVGNSMASSGPVRTKDGRKPTAPTTDTSPASVSCGPRCTVSVAPATHPRRVAAIRSAVSTRIVPMTLPGRLMTRIAPTLAFVTIVSARPAKPRE